MRRHKIDSLFEQNSPKFKCNVFKDSLLHVVVKIIGGIMQAARISVDFSVPVPNELQFFLIIAVRHRSFFYTTRQNE